MKTYIDTKESFYFRNIAIWFDGTFRPARGHHGDCVWTFDGQFFVHHKLSQ